MVSEVLGSSEPPRQISLAKAGTRDKGCYSRYPRFDTSLGFIAEGILYLCPRHPLGGAVIVFQLTGRGPVMGDHPPLTSAALSV